MGTLVFQATLGGQVNLTGPNTASTFTINVPAVSGTMAALASVTNNGVAYVNGSGQPTSGSALTFDGTTLISSGFAGPLNGTVGATTPATGAFTTLSASSTVTLSGGTANGVTYLNGSKVLTSGSALTFDGTSLGMGNPTVYGTRSLNSYTGTTASAIGFSQQISGFGDSFLGSNNSGSSVLGMATGTFGQSTPNNIPWTVSAYGSEQMRLTSTGLGIGTSSPGDKIHAAAATAAGLSLQATGTGGSTWRILSTDNAASLGGGYLGFNNGSYRMVLDSSGNLGIGTTSPSQKLHVKGIVNYEAISGSTNFWQQYTYTDNTLRWNYNGAGNDEMMLDSSGNLGLGVTPSAWASSVKVLQVSPRAAIWGDTSQSIFSHNMYTSSGVDKYIADGYSTLFTQQNGAYKWLTAASGTAGNAITFTQAMTLDASGRLLIGLTSSGNAGSIEANGTIISRNQTINTFAYDQAGIDFNASTREGRFFATSASGTGGYMAFYTGQAGGTEKARIDSSGNLLVGTTDSGRTTGIGIKLDIAGYATTPTVSCVGSASTNSADTYHIYSTGAAAYRFYVGYGGTINATSTTITGISDRRLKENIRDLDEGLDTVMALKPRKFDWKEGKGKDIKNDRGWIAQEFETVFPDMIEEWRDPAPEGEEPYKAVNANLIPTLVKAIQELNAKFEAYKASHP